MRVSLLSNDIKTPSALAIKINLFISFFIQPKFQFGNNSHA